MDVNYPASQSLIDTLSDLCFFNKRRSRELFIEASVY